MTNIIERLEAWSKANPPTTQRQVITGLILGAIILIAASSFIGERRQLIASSPSLKKDLVVCQPANHGAWFNDCSQVFAATDVLLEPATVPTKVMISYDGLVLRVSAAIPLRYHHEIFTDTPPTLAHFNGVRYVEDRVFFNEQLQAVLRVGDEQITLEWDAMPHWRVPDTAVGRALSALQHATSAELMHNGGRQHVAFSVADFSAALEGLPRRNK